MDVHEHCVYVPGEDNRPKNQLLESCLFFGCASNLKSLQIPRERRKIEIFVDAVIKNASLDLRPGCSTVTVRKCRVFVHTEDKIRENHLPKNRPVWSRLLPRKITYASRAVRFLRMLS